MAMRWNWRRIPRPVRIGLWSVAALLALAVIGGGILLATFDPDSLKPRLIAAVRQETGRDLAFDGRIGLGLSLQPTLVVRGAALSNPPGFSRPRMATLEELDLTLGLWPLLSRRIQIDRLVLVHPDILLETDAKGRDNWVFAPETAAAPRAASGTASGEKAPVDITVAEVRIEGGTLAYRDERSGQTTSLGVTRLDASAPTPGSNLHFTTQASYNGTGFTLAGDVGPLTRLQYQAADTPWPVQLTLAAAGAKLAVEGTFAQPLRGRGYALKLTANVPDLAALAPLLPGQKLPALHDVNLSAQVADSGGRLPTVSSLSLHVGGSDLTPIIAGLRLDRLDVAAAALDQPVRVSAQGSFADQPLALSGTAGAPAGLFSGARSLALDVNVQAAGSLLAASGSVALGNDNRLAVQASVKSDMIDADALLAAFGKPVVPPGSGNASPAPAPAPAAGPGPKPAKNSRVIPDTPIPFGELRAADADLALNLAQLKWGGVVYRAVALHLVLRDGRLRIDPFSADLPEGRLDGALTADATQDPPQVALRLHSPGLAVNPLLTAFGFPGYASGNLEVQADLHGAGDTPHAIAGTLGGSLGLAMVNGTVDNRLLGSMLGFILREINLLDLVGRGGTSQVKCFATRLDGSHGIGTFRALVLQSTQLTMDGGGSVNLGAESLDLRVRPQAQVGTTGLVVPLRVTGSLRTPAVASDPTAAVTANAGTVAGAVIGGTTPLGIIAGLMGGQKLLGGSGEDCGPALALARGGAAAPASEAAPVGQAVQPSAPASKPKPPNAGALLRQLLR